MYEENVTLIGYNSKKQTYVYPIVGILVFIIAIFFLFFAEGNKKFASIGLIIFSICFFLGFVHLSKQPQIALKIIDDKYIIFYSYKEETVINLSDVIKIYYWPAQFGLKITVITHNGSDHFTYLLENIKEVKDGCFVKYYN